MGNLEIQETKNTPNVLFTESGNFEIKGKMYSEDVMTFFTPILNWLENFEADNVSFIVKLDYMNTSASKMLFTVLKKIEENEAVKTFKVEWYFEEDDEDHYDVGKEYEDSLEDTEFEFHPLSEDIMAA